MALRFPNDLSDRYFFDLKFKTYTRPDPFSGKIDLSSPAALAASGLGNIVLPIPSNLIDSQRLNWAQERDPGAGVLGASIDSAIEADLGILGKALGTSAVGVISGLSEAVNQMSLGIAGNASSYVLQKLGLAANPVLTQMFKHPEFKQHNFSWTFAPESPNESQLLQAIINTIKEQSLPSQVAGGIFYGYPSIAMIQIYTGNNGNLYNFQPCVITSVSVNYAPNGVPSFFGSTNAPSMVKLDISFLEIILNTRENLNGSNISGFDFSLGGLGDSSIKNKALEALNKIVGTTS